MSRVQNWLVIGVPRNWEIALTQPVPLWGLKESFQLEFNSLRIGDLLWLYATSPIKGVIGVGTVKDKYVDIKNLVWEKEIEEEKVIWPLRFRIHVLRVLPMKDWTKRQIKIEDFNIFWQRGFHLLTPEHAMELMRRASDIFGVIDQESVFSGATIIEDTMVRENRYEYITEKKQDKISHKKVQEEIAEIGKLQFYYTELEYPIQLPDERKNLDVVWKRELNGVPTFAFEVELSGMIERAIERLKFANKIYNSRPRLVVPEELLSKVNNIISSSERDFRETFRVYTPSQIQELIQIKRQLRALEQNLALY